MKSSLADETGNSLRAARARQDTEGDLWESDLAGIFLGDAQVCCHGDLESAAYRMTVQSSQHQLGRLLESVQGLVGMQAEVVLEVGIGALQHVDVGAGAEELLPQAGEYQDVDVGVEPSLENGLVQLAHHLVGVAVGGWGGERQVGDPVSYLV